MQRQVFYKSIYPIAALLMMAVPAHAQNFLGMDVNLQGVIYMIEDFLNVTTFWDVVWVVLWILGIIATIAFVHGYLRKKKRSDREKARLRRTGGSERLSMPQNSGKTVGLRPLPNVAAQMSAEAEQLRAEAEQDTFSPQQARPTSSSSNLVGNFRSQFRGATVQQPDDEPAMQAEVDTEDKKGGLFSRLRGGSKGSSKANVKSKARESHESGLSLSKVLKGKADDEESSAFSGSRLNDRLNRFVHSDPTPISAPRQGAVFVDREEPVAAVPQSRFDSSLTRETASEPARTERHEVTASVGVERSSGGQAPVDPFKDLVSAVRSKSGDAGRQVLVQTVDDDSSNFEPAPVEDEDAGAWSDEGAEEHVSPSAHSVEVGGDTSRLQQAIERFSVGQPKRPRA